MISNVGISGMIILFFWLIGLILTLAVIVAVFQMRNYMKETTKALQAIHHLLAEWNTKQGD